MKDGCCPLCGRTSGCRELPAESASVKLWHCDTYDLNIKIGEVFPTDEEEQNRALNLALEYLLRRPFFKCNGMNKWWYFICSEKADTGGALPVIVNLAERMKSYPESLIDKAPRMLDNIATRHPNYGEKFTFSSHEHRLLFIEDNDGAISCFNGTIELLTELGYLTIAESPNVYMISAKGWQEVEKTRQKNKEIKQGFIAMSFRDDTFSIREAFRTAISDSGYLVRIIDEKEHNNQIVPEIFYEIERSKFVVVDVTYPNYGAYYEAGYAQALGKPVIICCRESEFKSNDSRPHFDISQKSMVVWKDENDLISRLKRRIEATVIS